MRSCQLVRGTLAAALALIIGCSEQPKMIEPKNPSTELPAAAGSGGGKPTHNVPKSGVGQID
jgi:hypothetical protein